jgi:serine/threonine protein phosphatase PrpC
MSEVTAAGGLVLAVASLTDPGLKRQVNEDSLFAESPVFLVADGMGGYEAGDLASAAVVDAFRPMAGPGFAELTGIRTALVAASAGVAAVAGDTKRGAGSTVTGAVIVEHEGVPHWLVFNVGDSRVYRHFGSELEQLTVDQSTAASSCARTCRSTRTATSSPARSALPTAPPTAGSCRWSTGSGC